MSECNLPDVKFENFAAAKSCLQSKLQSIGGVVKRLAIVADQNARNVWRVILSAQNAFPQPAANNFVAVRALLNQHIPHRGVLRTINLECDMSTTEQWYWEVTYGIKTTSRIQKAIVQLKTIAKTVAPCLKTEPVIRRVEQKIEKLSSLEKSKNNSRFFYQLRKAKNALSRPKLATQVEKTNAASPVISKATTENSSDNRVAKERKSQPYGNFVKGEVLLPTKSDPDQTKTHNVAPDYNKWSIKRKLYSFKTIGFEEIHALHILQNCRKYGVAELLWATNKVKTTDSTIVASDIPELYAQMREKLNLSDAFLSRFKIKYTHVNRYDITNDEYSIHHHVLCSH